MELTLRRNGHMSHTGGCSIGSARSFLAFQSSRCHLNRRCLLQRANDEIQIGQKRPGVWGRGVRHVVRAAAETEESIGTQVPTANALRVKYGNRYVRILMAGSLQSVVVCVYLMHASFVYSACI